MPMQYWFPTPIYSNHAHAVLRESIKKEIIEVFNKTEFYDPAESMQWNNNQHLLSTRNFNDNIIEKHDMKNFKLFLNE